MLPNAIVLVTDRLGSGYLGPYGNTWIETPAWNRLAARATLYETAMIDSPNLIQLYNSYWYGQHAFSGHDTPTSPSLIESLADRQVESWLITDERLVAEQQEAEEFDQRVVLPAGGAEPAGTMEETQLARVFATVLDVLQQAKPPFLVWVHAQAMQSPWDAPYHLRTRLAEEEDPDPTDLVEPPEVHLVGDCDPDLLLGFQQAYGGQVILLDSCLDVLLDSLWSSSLSTSTALLATSARGFPLGEHQYVGRGEFPLFGELLQVPWMISWPESAGASWRMQQTVQPPDMYTTLVNWFRLPQPGEVWGRSLLHRDVTAPVTSDQLVACCVHDQQQAIRVPGWFLRRNGQQSAELFVKPDDRWEFNEIASRCGHVVDELTETLSRFEAAAQNDDRQQLPPLSDWLHLGAT